MTVNKNPLRGISDEMLDVIATRFRSLGEVSRLILIQELQNGERSVTELVDSTGLSQPNVSRHLAVLAAAGLIGKRKDGLHVFYRVIDESLVNICKIVCKSVSR